MSKELSIDEPHGYLKDADGNVVMRFGNWNVGTHSVPDAVESVEYVDGPNAHTEPFHDDYKTVL